jgi:hypothetical protein
MQQHPAMPAQAVRAHLLNATAQKLLNMTIGIFDTQQFQLVMNFFNNDVAPIILNMNVHLQIHFRPYNPAPIQANVGLQLPNVDQMQIE